VARTILCVYSASLRSCSSLLRFYEGDAAAGAIVARSRGIRLIPYIDDFLFAYRDSTEFVRVQASVLAELAAAGLIVSRDKCQLSRSHVVKFLGFIVDTLFSKFRPTSSQKQKLRFAVELCLRVTIVQG
jgi:hypothetical protein